MREIGGREGDRRGKYGRLDREIELENVMRHDVL